MESCNFATFQNREIEKGKASRAVWYRLCWFRKRRDYSEYNLHMAFANPDPEQIRALLKSAKAIAVVGFSTKPARPSYNIARQLQRFGYRIIPVRPGIS